ncbi:MAG: hypothetical protein QGF78_05515 [Candidatus Bathyarchaeota archaeon]|nr:hypothetical protein [Candidatus Bathyarchaeota archaeon]
MEPNYPSFMILGIILLISGLLLVLLPLLTHYLPYQNQVPWFLIWGYRRNGFYFVTSPLLIVLSLISLIAQVYGRR